MHVDEIPLDAPRVAALVAARFPQWAGLPCTRVDGGGTQTVLFRLGEELVARLPRTPRSAGLASFDAEWLPFVGERLPVAVPRLVALAEPVPEFPWDWGVYRWLHGEHPPLGTAAPGDALAEDVTRLVAALRAVRPPAVAPPGREPLEHRDEATRRAIRELAGELDAAAATAAWEAALDAPAEQRWIHGDLLPANLLVRGGRLTGVLDWSSTGVGDASCDLLAGWGLLTAAGRRQLREALGVDAAAWARGRGWALSVGLVALPYYRGTNPVMTAVAEHLVREAVADTAA